MANIYDLVIQTVAGTPGTSTTINLGSAAIINGSTYLTLGLAGTPNGAPVYFSIIDPVNGGVEQSTAIYNSAGPSLTGRTVITSSNSNLPINASSSSLIRCTPSASLLNDASLFTTCILGSVNRVATGTPTGFQYVRDDQTLAYPFKATVPSATDWNNVQIPGQYTKSSMSNSPDGTTAEFYVEVVQQAGYVPVSSVYLKQTATNTATNATYVRVCSNGTWASWRRVDSRVLVSSLNASSSSSLDFPSVFTTEFPNWEICLNNLVPASDSIGAIRVYSGGSLQSTSYWVNYYDARGGSGTAGGATSTGTSIQLSRISIESTSPMGFSMIFRLYNPKNTVCQKAWNGFGCSYGSSDSFFNTQNYVYSAWSGTGALDGFNFFFQSGVNIASGNISIYGLV